MRLEHRVSREETADFIAKLQLWLEAGGLDQIYHWLKSVPLDDFNPYSVEPTETLRTMINISRSALENELTDWLEDRTAFTLESAFEKLNAPKDIIRRHLTSLGYVERRLLGRKRVWVLKSTSNEDALIYLQTNPFPF